MPEWSSHASCVDAWAEQLADPMSAEQVVQAYERAFGALWRHAEVALGSVTLVAVGDRVLRTVSERFPLLMKAKVDSSGISFNGLREKAGSLPREQLAEAMRSALLELLTILGNLTAEILTPALHAELIRSGAANAGAETGGSPRKQGKAGTS